MTKYDASGITAAELLAQLSRDPDFQRAAAERDRADRLRDAQLRADEHDIVTELSSTGVACTSVWDLIGGLTIPGAAISVLLRHLDVRHHPRVREGLVRALVSAEDRDRARVKSRLLERLAAEGDESVRDAMLLVIGKIAGPGDLVDLTNLLIDPTYGESRIMLLSALTRFGARGQRVLADATSDPVLRSEATRVLRLSTAAHRAPVPDPELAVDELISIGLDGDQLEPFLRLLAADLMIPEASVAEIMQEIAGLELEAEERRVFPLPDGERIVLQFFVDDVEAIDIRVAGPERLRSDLERIAERVALA